MDGTDTRTRNIMNFSVMLQDSWQEGMTVTTEIFFVTLVVFPAAGTFWSVGGKCPEDPGDPLRSSPPTFPSCVERR